MTKKFAIQDHRLEEAVATAKLQVLNLEPIKLRLGEKWPRLSGLVHALFEKALKRTQGPLDGFMAVGELAYIATFHGRSPQEAALVCAAIGKDVCELLFGDGAGDIAVRNLVGAVAANQACLPINGEGLADTLEWVGQETFVTKSRASVEAEHRPTLGKAAASLARKSYHTALFPIWDLQRKSSNFVALSPARKSGSQYKYMSFRRLNCDAGDRTIADLEFSLLQEAGRYTFRLQEANKICAVAVGVSWDSLCAGPVRNRYVGILKEIPAALNCPLVIKIDEVPAGMQITRLVEIAAALNAGGARVLVEFQSDIRIPDLDVKLGVAGVGTRLPPGCSAEKAREIIGMLNRRLVRQSAFAFIAGLDNRGLIELARESRIRFGMGTAADFGHTLAVDAIPQFPLRMQIQTADTDIACRSPAISGC